MAHYLYYINYSIYSVQWHMSMHSQGCIATMRHIYGPNKIFNYRDELLSHVMDNFIRFNYVVS